MVAAVCLIDPDPDREVLEEVRIAIEGGRVGRQVEDELVLADLELALQERTDPAIAVGHLLGEELRATVGLQAEESYREAPGGDPQLEVQHVGRDGRAGIGHCYPPRMADLTIRVGDLHFTARWEAAAPRTRAALQPWLPIRSQLIHCKWSGEGTWIPFGDRRPEVGYENHTAHPAPGQLLIYTGDLSECEILFPYGACSFSSRVGQLAGNHFATVVGGMEQLPELGRRVLWEGAQPIEIEASA